MPIESVFSTCVLLMFLARAVWTDLREHRISNELVLGMLFSALMLKLASDGTVGIFSALGGATVGLLLLLPFYLLKGMGAADVKLMAAVGAFFDPLHAALGSGFTLVAGMILALGVVRIERIWPNGWLSAGSGFPTTRTQTQSRSRFAYAPAIAIGALATLLFEGAG